MLKRELNLKILFNALLVLCMSLFMVSCDDDDDMTGVELTGESTTYILEERSNSGVSGTAVFEEVVDGSTKLTISLSGTSAGNMHPSHIHNNSAAMGGGIAISLTDVDGETGVSETIIEALDDGTSITYDELILFDGYINVHLSEADLGTVVAQGDIGNNALTGETVTYPLETRDVAGIAGEVTFEQRMSGFALATISLTGTPAGGEHPAHIHANSASEGGPIIFTFNPVDGDTGVSVTEVRTLDDGTALTYDDILVIDGYVNVHLSASELSTLVAQGNIGSNF